MKPAWASAPVTVKFNADYIRHALRKAVTDDSVKALQSTDGETSLSLLAIYEGQEREWLPGPPVPGANTRDNARPQMLRQRSPKKGIIANSSGRPLPEALHEVLRPYGASVTFRPGHNVLLAQDNDLRTTAAWPLNWKLGEEARRPMTCSEVEELLKANYGWDDGSKMHDGKPSTLAKGFSFCSCANETIWDGDTDGKNVRDLVEALLRFHKASCKERLSDRVLLYQVIPISNDGRMIRWNILGF